MFFITAMSDVLESKHFEDYQGTLPHLRCVGFMRDLEKAKRFVEDNNVGCYGPHDKYVLIEHIPEGIHEFAKQIAWFSYNYQDETWFEIEKPPNAFTKCNYAIGL